ncbi:MAG TPA: hypothetical protein VHE13_17160 [Opitutus sp.]|nr:hypothetical protein [Opitutus sp.]
MSRFATSGEIEVESVRYGWEVRHFASASSMYAPVQGISACIYLPKKRGTELIVDFPPKDYLFVKPRSTREFEARLRKCVSGALAMGWNPEARGKPFRVDATHVEEPIQLPEPMCGLAPGHGSS